MDSTETTDGGPETPTGGSQTGLSGSSGGEGGSWRDSVPSEYQQIADKFTSPSDVVRSYAELERRLGGSLDVPKNGADPAEREEFYNRLGRPESPADYDIQMPDNLPSDLKPDETGKARQERFLSAAHQMGLTRYQAQAAINWYYSELQSDLTQGQSAFDNQTAELDAALRKEWGNDYDKNIEYGSRALEAFGDPETLDQLEDIVGSASVVRMMARIGRSMGEAGGLGSGIGAGQQKNLEDELSTLMKREDYWHNEDIQRRVRDINVRLYGTKSVVGSSPDRTR